MDFLNRLFRILKVREMTDARQGIDFCTDLGGELDAHFASDVDVLLAPDHPHGRLQPVEVGLGKVLVTCEIRVVVGEGICRRRAVEAPGASHVLLDVDR